MRFTAKPRLSCSGRIPAPMLSRASATLSPASLAAHKSGQYPPPPGCSFRLSSNRTSIGYAYGYSNA